MIKMYTERNIRNTPYASTSILETEGYFKSAFYRIEVIYEGNITLIARSKVDGNEIEMILTRGDVVFITPEHEIRFERHGEAKVVKKEIYVYKEKLAEICKKAYASLYKEINESEYPLMFKISINTMFSISEIQSELENKGTSERLNTLHVALIGYIMGQYVLSDNNKAIYPKWLKILLENMKEEEFLTKTTDEMVKTTNYSHGYVSRGFRKYMKMSIKSYIIKQKLAFACNMLSSSEQSLEEIAFRLDFSTLSNFIYLFKKEYGVTPGKYKKEHKR